VEGQDRGARAGVTGSMWAVASGVGFGVFQVLNRRALTGIDDAYLSTFVQLVAALVLAAAAIATQDLALLGDATAWSVVAFAAAGVVHFLFGWTFLNLSQQRIGAARTAPLLTTTPLFGLVIAAVTLGQIPRAAVMVAIAPMVVGAYVLSGGGSEARGADALFGIATAAMWATSAVLTLEALEGLPSPLLGVTLGMLAAVPSYALALLVHRRRHGLGGMARASFALKIAAAVLLALATWWRLLALDAASVGAVLALNLLSVPVTLLLAPLVVGRRLEVVTLRLWVGAALVMTGTLSLIAVENA
jgi:DME family drug/metabolite transporter